MLLIKQVSMPLDTDFDNIKQAVSHVLKVPEKDIISVRLYRKSVDARHKNNIFFCCSFLIEAKNEKALLKRCKNAETYTEKPYRTPNEEAHRHFRARGGRLHVLHGKEFRLNNTL